MTALRLTGVDLAGLQRFAHMLHARLPQRCVILLHGTLGAGKTELARALAGAAGVDPTEVTSPTFTIHQIYQGQRKIHHIDAYRLADDDDFLQLGGGEIVEDPAATVLVEWPERIAGCLPPDALWIEIEIESTATRALRLRTDSVPLGNILQNWAAS